MNRRRFLTTTAIAGAASTSLLHGDGHKKKQGYLELIRFVVRNRPAIGKLERYLGSTVIPGLNKLGCSPIGVFRPKHGSHGADVYMLVPHADVESFLSAWDKLEASSDFQAASDTTMEDQYYERMESTLMRTFSHMPEVEIPEAIDGVSGRIFELRIYEAHNRMKSTLKVEMFNVAEIEIFEDVGLNAVFYGQTLIGPNQPNLVYMLVHDDMEAHGAAWKRFLDAPAWKELSQNERYKGTVSKIHRTFLRPKPYSQL